MINKPFYLQGYVNSVRGMRHRDATRVTGCGTARASLATEPHYSFPGTPLVYEHPGNCVQVTGITLVT